MPVSTFSWLLGFRLGGTKIGEFSAFHFIVRFMCARQHVVDIHGDDNVSDHVVDFDFYLLVLDDHYHDVDE